MPPIEKSCSFFFFNDTATTEIYTLSLHDALPIPIGQTLLVPYSEVRLAQADAGRSVRGGQEDVDRIISIEVEDRLQVAGIDRREVGGDHCRRVAARDGTEQRIRDPVLAAGANESGSGDPEPGKNARAAETLESGAAGNRATLPDRTKIVGRVHERLLPFDRVCAGRVVLAITVTVFRCLPLADPAWDETIVGLRPPPAHRTEVAIRCRRVRWRSTT